MRRRRAIEGRPPIADLIVSTRRERKKTNGAASHLRRAPLLLRKFDLSKWSECYFCASAVCAKIREIFRPAEGDLRTIAQLLFI